MTLQCTHLISSLLPGRSADSSTLCSRRRQRTQRISCQRILRTSAADGGVMGHLPRKPAFTVRWTREDLRADGRGVKRKLAKTARNSAQKKVASAVESVTTLPA